MTRAIGARRTLLLASLLGSIACGSGANDGFGVALTLSFDASLDDATLASVTRLSFVPSGDETAEQVLDLARALDRKERIIYRPNDATRAIAIAVRAEDATGAVLGAGSTGALGCVPGKTIPASVVLVGGDLLDDGGNPIGDGGSPTDGSASPDGGVTGCAGSPTALLCDDFESGSLSTHGWGTDTTNGMVTIDTTFAHRGISSVHLHTNAVSAGTVAKALLTEHATLDVSTHRVRAFVYYGGGPTPNQRLDVMALTQDVASPNGVYLYSLFNFYNTSLSNFDVSSTMSGTATGVEQLGSYLPGSQWICVEWEVRNVNGAAGANGGTSVYEGSPQTLVLDGNDGGVPTQGTPPLQVLTMGQTFLDASNPVNAYDMWIDDVIVDTQPIGCTR